MSLKSLIEDKNLRIVEVPDKFISQLEKLEQGTYNSVIELLNRLEVNNGLFVPSAKNLRIASEISTLLRGVMLTPEYSSTLVEFAKEFDLQGLANNAYFIEAFTDFAITDFTQEIIKLSKRNAVNLMLNGVDSEFVKPLSNAIEQAVINNSGYQETLKSIQRVILGNPEIESSYLRYAKTWAHESFAVGDAAYTSAIGDELGIEWYWYSGHRIDTTRLFCLERNGKYFHKKEFELWGAGTHTPGFKTPSGGTWQGRRGGTDSKTIFSYRGGWNCGHSYMPTSFSVVPKKDLQRAVKLGYYKPTTNIELSKL